MNFSKCWRKLLEFLEWVFGEEKQPKISLLIPFSSSDPIRKRNLKWLLKYWRHELPGVEIVIGHSTQEPFCKGEALNMAARRAKGKVLVLLDADAYLPGSVINRCADRIIEEEAYGNKLWYVPYRSLYRLTEQATELVIASSPRYPRRFSTPLPRGFAEEHGENSRYGHRYGAMIMVFSRQAYEIMGSFDERFKGWGGEDVALLRTFNTLYGKGKTTNNDILHLWHPTIGKNWLDKMWEGQEKVNVNAALTNRYHRAIGNPTQMRLLVDEARAKNK